MKFMNQVCVFLFLGKKCNSYGLWVEKTSMKTWNTIFGCI